MEFCLFSAKLTTVCKSYVTYLDSQSLCWHLTCFSLWVRLEFGRKQGCNKVERERKKLIHKHKRELKGAVREIRRDNQFLARVKLSETMERDAERKRKVKELFNSLSTQEGEWKALKRRKMKGK
ncbi:unnamed protein product [Staurois parvus]|uniref:Uncharacterized protein n=1 Tax=Staurois parvus TaxID=386267 RepID=A0ABN9GZZ9_9NEOB|nr:unnamed protein product [Staurois parvus]